MDAVIAIPKKAVLRALCQNVPSHSLVGIFYYSQQGIGMYCNSHFASLRHRLTNFYKGRSSSWQKEGITSTFLKT